MDEAEVIFAQKLADCDAKVRRKALVRLRRYLSSRVKSGRLFSEDDLTKIWKGLYYCMWMQDKPLIQEELANSISRLIDCFTDDSEQVVLFMKVFFITIIREWNKIDRWRMDKYMMFIRRFLREYLEWLRAHDWEKKLLSRTFDVWRQSVISADGENIPEGLKYHFASIYLDELDQVGGKSMSTDVFMKFLSPYLAVLGWKLTSDSLFDSVLKEIFHSILLQFSEDLQPGQDESDTEERLQIPYGKIESALFDVGKSKDLLPERRKIIYDLVKKFRLATAGQDPFEEVMSSGGEVSDSEIDQAAKVLLKQPQKEEKLAYKRKKKRKSTENGVETYELGDMTLEAIENSPPKGKKLKATQKSPVAKNAVARKAKRKSLETKFSPKLLRSAKKAIAK